MTALSFSYDEADPPIDLPPSSDFVCQECQTPLTYGGRGKKPTKCTPRNGGDPECYGKRTPSTGGSRRSSRDVESALAFMDGLYDSASQVLMISTPNAAAELEKRIAAQQDRNRLAFEANPALAKRVAGWGGKAGMLGFILSNSFMMAGVARVAYAEIAVQRMMAPSGANGGASLSDLFSGFGVPA